MAAMMLILINFSINIIAAICWPPPLISQLFSPRLFKATPFFTAWLFLCGYSNHLDYQQVSNVYCDIINSTRLLLSCEILRVLSLKPSFTL